VRMIAALLGMIVFLLILCESKLSDIARDAKTLADSIASSLDSIAIEVEELNRKTADNRDDEYPG
jgi:hypothetical protein